MTERIVKTRKDHLCSYCQKTIPAGSNAKRIQGREARFAEDSRRQIGVLYYVDYMHNPLCEPEWLKNRQPATDLF